MEKFLILSSVLMISGAAIPSVIAAAIHEKQGTEDEIRNFQRKDGSKNFDESKIPGKMLVESDDFSNVTEEIRNILRQYVMMITTKQPGNPVADLNFEIDMDIKIKSIHEFIPNGVIKKERKLLAGASTIITNNHDSQQKIKSREIILRANVGESATIRNTFDMSGTIETPQIPVIGGSRKIGFKFSKTPSTTNKTSEIISKKIPFQRIKLKPHSSKEIISELYGTDFVSKYLLSFEIDERSEFSLQFKTTPSNAAGDIYIGLATAIEGHPNRIEGLKLKSALQEFAQTIDEKYPKTTINCGSNSCIEFENNKVYIKYFPLEINTVQTELYNRIEKID